MQIASILFAAGRGVRLRPLTDAIPKPAMPVLDLPLAAFPLAPLLADAPPVVMNVSHLSDVAIDAVEEVFDARVEFFIERPEGFGTAGTLKALEERLAERVLTCNADLVADLDPRELLAAHDASGAPATAAVERVAGGADFELADGRATRFVDRRARPDAAGGRFIGMAVFDRSALKLIPDAVPVGLGETVLRELTERGELAVLEHRGYALDVGSPAAYLRTSLAVLEDRIATSLRPPGDVVEGPAYVGPEVDDEGATLGPGAILLRGCAVEDDVHIERAIVWPGERVPAGMKLRDEIWAFGSALTAE